MSQPKTGAVEYNNTLTFYLLDGSYTIPYCGLETKSTIIRLLNRAESNECIRAKRELESSRWQHE